MNAAVPVVAGVATVAVLEATKAPVKAPTPNAVAIGGGTVVPMSQPGSSVNPVQPTGESMSVGQLNELHSLQSNVAPDPTAPLATPTPITTTTDPSLGQKLVLIDQYTSVKYTALTEAQRTLGALKIKNLIPGIMATADQDYAALSASALSAIAGYAGGALGAAIGGPVGAYLGAILAAYLGTEIATFLNEDLPSLQKFMAPEIANFVETGSALEGFGKQVGDWIEGIF